MAYIFGVVRRTALYGFITLIVTLCICKIKITDLFTVSNGGVGFKGTFSTILLWCLIALPIIEILFVVYRKMTTKRRSYGLEEFFTTLFRDLTHPFLSFGTLIQGIFDKGFISTGMGWVETIFSFVSTWGWIVFLVISVLAI